MALKDITLGQYFPGNSPVHRLDPRTKLICVVLYIVALFLAAWFVTYAVMLAVLAGSIYLSKVPVKSVFRGLKPVLFIVVFLIGHVLNLLINLLGAYVHTNRLQYVEFFGKFYEGGGRKFEPFAAKTKYFKFTEE